MFVIVNKYVLAKGFDAVTLWPFIFIKNKNHKQDVILMNHERIHLRQQLELLVLPFFLWYFLEYLLRLWKYRNSYAAYKHISFEREAYLHERDLGYLKGRKFWRFLRFV